MKDACDAIKSEFNIDEEIDVTLMARYVPPGKNVAKLKVIAANLPDGSPLWNQELDVGDSIPGIAFKRRLARSFVITAEDSGKPHGYMPATPDPGYTVVHSLPLLYENADGPAYGVITIASKAEFSALTFKANRDLAGRQKLYATVLNATVVQLHNLCAVPLTS